jgi:antirestriction protein ArdC
LRPASSDASADAIRPAAEDLVVELGAAFVCADLAITPKPCADHASYIASWLIVRKNDKRAIFTAAAHAQRAVDYLHGLQESKTHAEVIVISGGIRIDLSVGKRER